MVLNIIGLQIVFTSSQVAYDYCINNTWQSVAYPRLFWEEADQWQIS